MIPLRRRQRSESIDDIQALGRAGLGFEKYRLVDLVLTLNQQWVLFLRKFRSVHVPVYVDFGFEVGVLGVLGSSRIASGGKSMVRHHVVDQYGVPVLIGLGFLAVAVSEGDLVHREDLLV